VCRPCYDGGMSERDVRIHLDTGTTIKTLLILAGVALLWYLRDIVLILLAAVVIASAMEPGIRPMVRWGLPRILSVIFMYVVVIAAFGAIVIFFIPPILQDTAGFFAHLPSTLQSFDAAAGHSRLVPLSSLAALLSSANLQTWSLQLVGGTPGDVLGLLSAIFGGLISFGFVVVFSFYFCVQDTGVDDFLRIVTPLPYQGYVGGLWKRSQDKIGRWIQGQLLLGLIVGVLLFLGLTILQVPYALLLAVTAAAFELIPVFGQILAMIPAAALAFGAGGTTMTLLVIALYVLVQQFEAHLIYPLVVRKIVGIPPLLVILSLIVGGKLAGFVGVLLAVPIAAALRELVNDLETRRRKPAQ